MKMLSLLIAIMFITTQAFAGFLGYSGTTNLGAVTTLKCSTGLTCTKNGSVLTAVSSPALTGTSLALSSTLSAVGDFSINTSKFTVAGSSGNTHVLGDFDIATNKFTVAAASGNTAVAGTLAVTGASTLTGATDVVGNFSVATNKFTVAAASGNSAVAGTLGVTGASTLTGGVVASSGQFKNYMGWKPSTLTSGTSTQGSATVVYLTQIYVDANATFTGIKVNNGATVGTNKYIVALFNSSGGVVANSALAGTTSSGADGYQTIPFTSTYAAVGPAVYWIGVYIDGTTDRFRTVPAVGQYAGLAGSVSGQTFGTVATVTLPTTFSADLGPVAFTY